ncbi:PIN domain-containing protein [Verrucosispora sp. WMMA2044]|uniref:Ribonuclease VapC n=1 Tax=Verrucosispora sioxanthis TaxID=2499994 RepID=A0A6M1L3Q4_9ACTN|nr:MULTISPECIES: PIN domain-containing protein [Micromonospora]NEE64377.1 PIN domain nuclease [Verrucosispora sioxanthis]NGM13487.1 PIN domain nuclease [Verrucosispora sioxanthis]WBB49509.1 PIN domain-containing protein [Verrucosispora sp. WMMA2044]
MTPPPGLYLIDTSAWGRLRQPIVGKRILALLEERLVATCLPLDLEDGRSARDFRDAMTVRARRAELMIDLPISPAVATRARDLQLALTARGHHRAASPVDLMVAASAAEYAATVLHYDRDFDLLAEVGGPRSEWVSPPGTLS